MRVARRRLGLSILAVFVLLNLTVVPMVSAGFLTIVESTYTQDLVAHDNDHTYLYLDGYDVFQYIEHKLGLNHDTSFETYRYLRNGWSSGGYSYDGPSNRLTYALAPDDTMSGGYLDNVSALPIFADFHSSYSDYSVSIQNRIGSFHMPFNEEQSLIMGDLEGYIGVFNVTSEEYFHLTISSRQDSTGFYVLVQDPNGVFLMENYVDDGDARIVPFQTTGPGMYSITIFGMSDSDGLAVLDLLLEPVTPESLPYGTIVEGELPGSEWIVKNDGGDIVHQEKAPTAHTYKFSSNTTYPGKIQYSINYPELDGVVYDIFPAEIIVSSPAVVQESFPYDYFDWLSPDGATFYYQSFNEETYYLTFIGMDDTKYTLLNREADAAPLPLEEPFFLDNVMNQEARYAFTLSLGQDSVLKVNSTESGGFDWDIWTIDGNGMYRSPPLGDSSTFHGAQPTYLPAGNYLLEAFTGGMGSWGIYEFALGPVVDGAGGIGVDNGDLIGVRVPTDAMTFYKANISLETHDNISVMADYDIFSTYGRNEVAWDNTLGNRQSGTSWLAVGTNFTANLMSGDDMFCDGFAVVVVSPYDVENNTPGGGNKYYHYTVDYDVAFEEYSTEYLNATNTLTITSIPRWSNFTLGDPGDSTEYYGLWLTADIGTWINITFFTEDVDSIGNIWVYQEIDGCTTNLDMTDLSDTAFGTIARGGIEFGSVSEDIIIVFQIGRTLSAEGSLDLLVTTYTTNSYVFAPTLSYIGPGGPGGPGIDSGTLMIVGGIGAVVVVVIVVVYVIRKKGII